MQIVDLMAKELQKRLKEQDIEFDLTEAALRHIVKEGHDPQYGARPLRRALQRMVEDRLSEELITGNISKGDAVLIDVENGQLKVTKKESVKQE
jgi:ATP-dependent Clp protease ATP-binding subunit ClpC